MNITTLLLFTLCIIYSGKLQLKL